MLYRGNHYQTKLSMLTSSKLEKGATKHPADAWEVRNTTQTKTKLTGARMTIYHLSLCENFLLVL